MNPREEIKDIAPELSRWTHEEGYEVPVDYFSSLSDIMVAKVEEKEKLKPYFDSLPDQIMSRVREEKQRVSISRYYKYGVAAAILILVGNMLWSNFNNEIVAPTYSMMEYNEDLEYIVDEVSMEDIFDTEFIDDESLEEVLTSGVDPFYTDDSAEHLFLDADDELLEDFL